LYKDPSKQKAFQRKYRKDHREQANKRAMKWRGLHPDKVSGYNRKNNLKITGWTSDMVEQTKIEQGNACAICRKIFISAPRADHKHVKPPEPRGLLCLHCNVGLGHFFESPEWLRAAADYLEAWS
jgi:hypothetical protein